MNAWFQSSGRHDASAAARRAMVERQLRARGIRDARVLAAMGRAPREAFVPQSLRDSVYGDGPLPIGEDQTISQPYIVAAMTESLQAPDGARVLEVGTGSGYQTAVLAEMGLVVYTVEYLPRLAGRARAVLEQLGYSGIHYKIGDGRDGWPAAAPFDGIIVTAAPARVPAALAGQLKPGGRLVIPVGRWDQELRVYTAGRDGGLSMERLFPVRFVPLVGDG
jgi:protein-L-isoaspartate(D-aspartate) O-methyltransferase